MQDEKNQNPFILEIIETFVSSIVVLLVLYLWVAFPEVVFGASMEPSLYTGERILVERITPKFREFKRGDIVVLHPPGDDSVDYVKRIIALPNEIIKISECSVYISRDGKTYKLEESYLASGTCTQGGPILKEGRARRLESDEYVVMGDNREKSADSRIFGPVKKETSILGKVAYRFWPLNKLELL